MNNYKANNMKYIEQLLKRYPNLKVCKEDIIKTYLILVEEFKNMIDSMPEKNYKIKIGSIATGDIFCTESWMKDKIRAKFNADVVDMECGAIAQVCYLDNMPFIAIRAISDTPNGENARTFNKNLKFASKRCSNILKEFLS